MAPTIAYTFSAPPGVNSATASDTPRVTLLMTACTQQHRPAATEGGHTQPQEGCGLHCTACCRPGCSCVAACMCLVSHALHAAQPARPSGPSILTARGTVMGTCSPTSSRSMEVLSGYWQAAAPAAR